jgi:predicted ATPase
MFMGGDPLASCLHVAEGMSVHDLERHAPLAEAYGSHDAETCGQNFLGWSLALRGDTDEADRVSLKAVTLARRLGNPFSLTMAHFFAAGGAYARRDPSAIRANAEAAVVVAREQDFRLLRGQALTLLGSATIDDGRFQEGMEQIVNGLAEVRATGAYQFLPYLLSVKAQALLVQGEPTAGLEALEEAFSVARITGEAFWQSELHRLKGELQLAADVPAAHVEAEHSFVQAIDIATSQGARLLALRASVSLGRLLRRLKRDGEARQRVSAALAEFSQGVAQSDVVEAREILADKR